MPNSKLEDRPDTASRNFSNTDEGIGGDHVDDLSSSNYSSDVGNVSKFAGDENEKIETAHEGFKSGDEWTDDWQEVVPEPNYSSLEDVPKSYPLDSEDLDPGVNFSSQPPDSDDDDRDHWGEWDGQSKPDLTQFDSYDEFTAAMVDWKTRSRDLGEQRAQSNLRGMAELGLDPAGNFDPELKSTVALLDQAEKSLAEKRPGSGEYHEAAGRVKYLTEMRDEKLKSYQDSVEKIEIDAAKRRIYDEALNVIQSGVRGDITPASTRFNTAKNAFNSAEAEKTGDERLFIDVLSDEDRHSYRNAGVGTAVFCTFPASYDGNPLEDAQSHGFVRQDGTVDLAGWAIKNGGTVQMKGRGGRPEEVVSYD